MRIQVWKCVDTGRLFEDGGEFRKHRRSIAGKKAAKTVAEQKRRKYLEWIAHTQANVTSLEELSCALTLGTKHLFGGAFLPGCKTGKITSVTVHVIMPRFHVTPEPALRVVLDFRLSCTKPDFLMWHLGDRLRDLGIEMGCGSSASFKGIRRGRYEIWLREDHWKNLLYDYYAEHVINQLKSD